MAKAEIHTEKFEIRNRWTSAVQITAEITCAPDATIGVKIGLAVKWARRNGAVLSGAVLSGAVLSDTDLRGADLRGADLSGADLRDTVLSDTVLRGADLPQFSCTTGGNGGGGYGGNGGGQECRDQFITHQSGKGKLGFPLVEVKTFIMGNGNEFESRIETIELSTAKLDSMLFEIPIGYKEAASMSELQEMNVSELLRTKRNDGDGQETKRPIVTEEKPAGTTRIGVFVPHAAEELATSALQEKLVNALFSDAVDAVAIQSTADATRFHCDYVLNTDFTKIKAGSKMGGILKAIRNADPGASSTYTIELSWTLLDVNGGAIKAKDDLSGKFEGKIDEAAGRALEKTAVKVHKSI